MPDGIAIRLTHAWQSTAKRMVMLSLCLIVVCIVDVHSSESSTEPHEQTTHVMVLEAGVPLLENFSRHDHGGHDQSWAVLQHRSGLIYVGNNNGVLEFDGVRWRLFPMEHRVRSLATDDSGRIFVGAVGDLGYLEADDGGGMQFRSLLEHLPEAARDIADVWGTFSSAEGVYFSTLVRLLRWDGTRFDVWEAEPAFHAAIYAAGRLFVRAPGRGLLELVNGELELVRGGERFADERVYAILPWGDQGQLLIGTRTQGFWVFDGQQYLAWPTDADEKVRLDLIYQAVELPGDRVAIGTLTGGLYVLDREGKLLKHISRGSGLQDDSIYSMHVDRQQGLWLALDRGITRIEAMDGLSRFDEHHGLRGTVLKAHRHQGLLYVGTTVGLFVLEPGPTPAFRLIDGFRGHVWDLASVGDTLLVAGNAGVYVVEGRSGTGVLLRSSNGISFVLHVSMLHPGRVYIGTRHGLAAIRRVGGNWIDEGDAPGLRDEVRTIQEAADGRLWMGTLLGGVLRTSSAPQASWAAAGEIERFGTGHGLPDATESNVFALDGEVLFGTALGIYRFDEGTGRFTPDQRFAEVFAEGPSRVGRPEIGAAGLVWMALARSDDAPSFKGVAIPQADGGYVWETRPLRALARLTAPPLLAEPDGVVWLGQSDGLFRYAPGATRDYTLPFKAVIRSVIDHSGRALLFGGGAEDAALPYSRNRLRFEYAAPSYDARSENRFQVLLDGLDKQWSPWTDEPYIDYANLWEGKYQFRVRARNVYGTVGEEAAFAFRVDPPWYRTAWAYLGALLLISGITWSGFRWRFGTLQRAQQALELTVHERTLQLERSNADLERSNSELLVARQAADAASQAKSSFLANMSHEIRTPMNAVLGFAGLGQKLDLPPKAHDYFQKIARSGHNLLAILNDVLDFSKIEAGRIELESVAFDLSEVLDQVADLFSLHAADKKVELVFCPLPESLPSPLLGDPLRLSQVLINLVGNALKFTDAGHVRVQVELLATGADPGAREHARLRFSVQDSGIGISQVQQQKLFDAFSQADSSTTRHYGGTGLGLTISQRLIEQMGGSISVDSAPGAGSTFSFALDFPCGTAAIEQRELPPAFKGMHILVVDDSSEARDILHSHLLSLGFNVTLANSGATAIRALRVDRFDLILMDWEMPDMDGIETTRLIRADPALAGIPEVIMVTAHGRETVRNRAMQVGVHGLLIKPVSASLLFDTLVNALGIEAARPSRAPASATQQSECIRGARVLVADDNVINQQVATEILQGIGVHVDIASSGGRAVAMAAAGGYHAVLMDIQMPGMDGYTAARRIRESKVNSGVPIIAMTAHAVAGYHERCLAAGMNDYVTKPIDPDRLFASLAAHIDLAGLGVTEQASTAVPGAPSTLPGELPGIDVPLALRRLAGNERLLRELISSLADETRCPSSRQIRRALDAGDMASARALAHTVRGSAGNVSAIELEAAAAALETALRGGENERLDTCFDALVQAFERILETARSLQDERAKPAVAASSAADAPADISVLVMQLQDELRIHGPDADIVLARLRAQSGADPASERMLAVIEQRITDFDYEAAHSALVEWIVWHGRAAAMKQE